MSHYQMRMLHGEPQRVFSGASQPILQSPGSPFFDLVGQRTQPPCFLGDLDRIAQVLDKCAFHRIAEFLAKDHQVDFIIVQEAAGIDIGRPHCRPDIVDHSCLGMQDSDLQLIDPDAAGQHFTVKGSRRMEEQAAVGDPG
jgi:hypothetical protein